MMAEDIPKASSSGPNHQKPIDLREISIILDGWSRTCDTVLDTLNEQINKIIKS